MWILNVFLYLTFLFAPDIYQSMKASGAPCTVNISIDGDKSTAPQPVCFYDPSNTNE